MLCREKGEDTSARLSEGLRPCLVWFIQTAKRIRINNSRTCNDDESADKKASEFHKQQAQPVEQKRSFPEYLYRFRYW